MPPPTLPPQPTWLGVILALAGVFSMLGVIAGALINFVPSRMQADAAKRKIAKENEKADADTDRAWRQEVWTERDRYKTERDAANALYDAKHARCRAAGFPCESNCNEKEIGNGELHPRPVRGLIEPASNAPGAAQ